MRKLIVIFAVLAALIVIAVLALPALVDVNRYHGRIQAELQQRLNRPVTLGKMSLKLLPLAVRIENATIGEDPALASGRPFAQADELYVSARLLPLLSGEVQVDSVELRRPRIELIRDSRGAWNFATLGHKRAPEGEKEERALSLDKVRIRDGQIAITDLKQRQRRTVYDHIDLALDGYAPGKAFTISVAAHLPGEGAQMVKLEGRAGPMAETPVATPFDGRLKLDQVSLSAAQKFLNSPALAGTDAIASGDMEMKNQDERLDASGSLKLEGLRIRGTEVGYPVSAEFKLSDDLRADLLNIKGATLKLGSTPLAVAGTVNMGPTPAQLDLKINASNVSIQEAARLAAALGVAFNPGMDIAGRFTAEVRAHGATSNPALNGTLALENVKVSGKSLSQPVSVARIELALTPETIRSNQFTASTGNTSLGTQFALTQYTTAASAIELSLRTQNARVGELLNIAQAYGVKAVEGMSGTGSVSLDLRASGPLKNPGAMNFAGNGSLDSAAINLPQLRQPLQVRNATLRFTQNSMVLENVAMSLGQTTASGTVTMRNFAAPSVQFTLAADKINVLEVQQMLAGAPPKQAALGIVPAAHAATSEGMLAKMSGGGTLTIGSVLYDQLTLTNVRSTVALERGMVRLSPLTADLYGGREIGSILVDTRATPVTYTVASKLERVDANKLISSVSSLKQTIYGLLAANANTSFTATSSDQIARNLNGTLALNLKDGKIANVDVLHELASIGKFLGYGASSQPFTNIVQLTGNFDVRNGVAHTENLKAAIDGGTLAAVGDVDLASQALNLRLTAVLSKAMSERVGGTGVGGFMSTALANSKGELVMPVMVSGSFSQPRFAPDVQKIAEMKLQNLLPTAANPGQLSSGILGAVLGGKGSAQPGQPGGLEGIVGAVTGQQQRRQPQQSTQPQNAEQQQQQTQQQQQKRKDPLQDLVEGLLGEKKKK